MVAIIATVMISVLGGCKPVEKHYKSAYDAAIEKREAAMAEQMIPATGLLSDDGPQQRIVDGDTLFVVRERLSGYEGATVPRGWLIAVGQYKMNTNAIANVGDLQREGYKNAQAVRTTGGRWYAIADTAATLDAVRPKVREFERRHKGYPYVGLPGRPVLVNY